MASSSNVSTELTAIAHEQLKSASRAYAVSKRLQVVTLVTTLVAVFVPVLSYFTTVAAFLCQVATFYFRHQGQKKQGVGDEIRRRAMLQDALGPFDQTFDLTELLRRAGVKVRDRATGKAASDYFASTATDGLVRLRDHLRENAFWNRCLYGECAQTGLRFLAIVMSSAVFLFLLAVAIVPSSATTNLTRVFIALLASFVGYALLADVLSWRSAAGSIESLERRLDTIKQLSENDLRSKALGELLAIFAEYTVATSKVPPIPDAEYQKHRDGLNALWRERESGLTTPLLGSRSQASRP